MLWATLNESKGGGGGAVGSQEDGKLESHCRRQ